MRHASLIRAVCLTAATLVVVRNAPAQTACTTTGVTLKSFSPVDSLFANAAADAPTFTIKLNNVVTGCPTEYRVSRFSDFRDANWLAYSTAPSTVVQQTWFTAPVNGGTQITLYFQVRQKNPKAGQPISLIGGKTEVQPDFFFSGVLGRRIRRIYFG
jgi:hypothetical protein